MFNGGGTLESVFGKLRYRAEDYIVIPRGITYRLVPDKVEEEDYLILESVGPVRIPQRYLNHEGQIKMGSPYSERDFHGPTETLTIDKDEDIEILVKDGPRWTRVTMAHHPFDVVGWDGYVYPFTFNAQDFEPITGTVHQPPPIHQTFEIRGYVVCTFAPRMLDTHPEAVKIPWVHDNVEADEVLVLRARKFRFAPRHRSRLRSRCIRAGFRMGRIRARSWRARTQRAQKSWR